MSVEYNPMGACFNLYLQNLFTFEDILKTRQNQINEVLAEINNNQLLNYNFLDSYNDYPKYPADYKPIKNLYKYNILKIYDTYTSKDEYLFSSINKTGLLNLKLKTDKIPLKKIRDDYLIQLLFFDKFNDDLLDRDLVYKPINTGVRSNYIYKTFLYDSESGGINPFAVAFFLNLFISCNLKTIMNLYSSIQEIASSYSLGKNQHFIDEFNNYFSGSVKSEFSNNLTNFILNYTYQIVQPSEKFRAKISDIVNNCLNEFKEKYVSYLRQQKEINLNSIQTIVTILYQKIAEFYTRDLINSATSASIDIIPSSTFEYFQKEEINRYKELMKEYSPYNIKEYLFLTYLYKNQPLRFLNITQMVIPYYVESILHLPTDNSFTIGDLQKYANMLFSKSTGFNMDYILGTLRDTLTIENVVNEFLENDFTISYGFRSAMADYMEEFYNSSDFDTIIDDLLENVFSELKNSTQVHYNKNYYFNKILLKIYFRALLRQRIISGNMFQERETIVFEIFEKAAKALEGTVYSFNETTMKETFWHIFKPNVNIYQPFFENMLTTALTKQLHDDHILYYLNENI